MVPARRVESIPRAALDMMDCTLSLLVLLFAPGGIHQESMTFTSSRLSATPASRPSVTREIDQLPLSTRPTTDSPTVPDSTVVLAFLTLWMLGEWFRRLSLVLAFRMLDAGRMLSLSLFGMPSVVSRCCRCLGADGCFYHRLISG